jgi:hypothetical protein
LQAYRKTFQIDGIPEQEDVTTALWDNLQM